MPAKTISTAPPSHQAANTHHGSSQPLQQPGPTIIESQLIPDSQNGKAVIISSQESLSNNEKITSIDGATNELHGDWLLVTRKKKIPNSSIFSSTKTATPKANRFHALNFALQKRHGPPNQITPSRPSAPVQPRAPHTPKETKRRRHDHDTIKEPALQNPMPSVTTQKAPTKTVYMTKNIPQLPITKQPMNNGPQTHVPPEQVIPNHENHSSNSAMNTSTPSQTEPDPNNTSEAQNRDAKGNSQDDTIVTTEIHGLQDTNEEDMVT